ncbi:MAG: methionine synthase [Phycisphaeraceae bacterium]|nr:methionine synthase [Phycisphaeraceae bacterium]
MNKKSPFLRALDRHVLFFDGAMGTNLHARDLTLEEDYQGKENCPEILNLTRPDVIQEIHESFLAVGCDIVESNTFGGMPHVLVEFDLQDQCREICKRAAEIGRAACDRHATEDHPRFVAGSMGPGTKLVTLGQITFDDMMESYRQCALGMLDAGFDDDGRSRGVDFFLIETCQDLLQVKAATSGIVQAQTEAGIWGTDRQLPIFVSVTIETNGTMLLGSEISAALVALEAMPIDGLGMNCATGPREMTEHIRHLSENSPLYITVVPNAGIPVLVDGQASFPLEPAPMAKQVVSFVEELGVNALGGCCGTTPEHLKAMIEAVGRRPPVKRQAKLAPSCSSLYSPVELRQDNSLLMIGERTNANGSRKFKEMLADDDWDGLVSWARQEVRGGAHVLDVCVDYVGRDGVKDMHEVISRYVQQVPVPLVLDSTEAAVLEEGLKLAGGKCIVNSINLEDGESRFEQVCPMLKKYGAAVVALTIDEDKDAGMAKTAQRKLEIAQRIHDLCTKKYGIREEDILFDPLTFTIATGNEDDRRLGLETLDGIERISKAFPKCGIILGLSNISFGLKPAARVVLNSVFLHEAEQRGLTGAIVHPSKILPKHKIEDDQWRAALDLIYDRRDRAGKTVDGFEYPGKFDPLIHFIGLFPDDAAGPAAEKMEDLSIEERLKRHIIDGERQNLKEDLDEAMKKYDPLTIINEHLLGGMKVVGELFGSGQMQLPFVLQSAEVMKMSVAHLEPHMEKIDGETRGRLVLATVKGDVHDIGKNLIDIILSNNGYTVVNLGIKQPLNNMIEAVKEHKADALGMSGLLVKSVGVMHENLRQMAEQDMKVPVLVGGAALTRHYAETELRNTYNTGHVYYGRDAFEALDLMAVLVKGEFDQLEAAIEDRLVKRRESDEKIAAAKARKSSAAQSAADATDAPDGAAVEAATAVAEPPTAAKPKPARQPVEPGVGQANVPKAPFFGARVIETLDLKQLVPFVNRIALYRGQWGFKKGRLTDEEYQRQLADEVDPIFDRLAADALKDQWLEPKLVYGYFPCNSDGDDLIVFDAKDHDREVERFSFPRQSSRQKLCISDFFRPVDSGQRDVLGLSCVTMGQKVSEKAKALFESNQYQEYLYVHGMGVECAEALAEFWHKRMRQEMGIGEDDSPVIRDLFTQKYRGSRYSFGYPACPDMSDQEKLFRLLQPERIGCVLTENWQIDPEQSTSAIVVHHPSAKYFNV